jgi:integrase
VTRGAFPRTRDDRIGIMSPSSHTMLIKPGSGFRHTYISRLVMAGVDLRTVQELAGHKDIKMTIRYSHLSPSHKIAAVDTQLLNAHILIKNGDTMLIAT